MPFGKCPICGITYHLQVTDHAQWYKERGLKFGELLIEKCFGCWRELRVGDRVRVVQTLDAAEVKVDDVGHIIDVLTAEDGTVSYRVEGGDPPEPPRWTLTFNRDQITYDPRGQQPMGEARTALLKHRIWLHVPEPSMVYCTVEGKKRPEINVYDLYDQYAHWKLTPDQLVDEIRKLPICSRRL